MTNVADLIQKIAEIGQEHPSSPQLAEIEIFANFFLPNGRLDDRSLDKTDGTNISRRELLTRFLLLNAVIDQGPDIVGVRKMLVNVTNEMYHYEIRFLHRPLAFFQEIGIAIDQILTQHQSIKALRAEAWAQENRSQPSRYNLFMDNSKQALNYAVFRWGVPLALPLLLEKDLGKTKSTSPLLDYLETYPSAERMTTALKDHQRYGLGKAIGDKACHLFAKWMVSTFSITRRHDTSWGNYSFEVPYNSNAGRVLWRTGYLLHWASEEDYVKKQVIQKRQGKGGMDYLRVTNIRGMPTTLYLDADVKDAYCEISVKHLATHKKKPTKFEIQRLQHPFLLLQKQTVAAFDDGLNYIGTNFCFNHAQPKCKESPLKDLCEGHMSSPHLIQNYRT
jgi:hypothetical protein